MFFQVFHFSGLQIGSGDAPVLLPLTFTRHGIIKKFFPEKARFHAGKTWVWWAKWHEQQRGNHYRLSIFLLSTVTHLLFFFLLWSEIIMIVSICVCHFFLIVEFCYKHLLLVSCCQLKPCQGWGFIIQEDGGPNLFFHSNAIESGHWCLVGNEGMGWLFIDHSPISLHHLMGYIMRIHEISRFLLLKAVLNVVLVSIPLGMMIPRDKSCSTEAPEAEDQKL